MEKSIKILEDISSECLNYTSYYKYNRSIISSEKYRDGRVDASNWINELVYFYIKKEKNFLKEFIDHISNQKQKIVVLNDGDYKNGLFDQLNEIERKINDRIN